MNSFQAQASTLSSVRWIWAGSLGNTYGQLGIWKTTMPMACELLVISCCDHAQLHYTEVRFYTNHNLLTAQPACKDPEWYTTVE